MNKHRCRLAAYLLSALLAAGLMTGCKANPQASLYVNGALAQTVTVPIGTPLSAEEPNMPGYAFVGWYGSEDAQTPHTAAIEANTSLYAGFTSLFYGGLTFRPDAMSEEPIIEEYAEFEELGRVHNAALTQDGVVLRTSGYYGYHMEENPSVTMGVAITKEGVISGVWLLDSFAQSDGFPQQITQSYLDDAYEGEFALSGMNIEPVTGASATSKAVLYAVRTAAWYAHQVYGYSADTTQEDLVELNAIYPAQYTPIRTDYAPDPKKIGVVLFAAEGITAQGTQVVAMKVESALRFNLEGGQNSPYDASKPNPFVMIIIADKQSKAVLAYHVLQDGTKKPEYFSVPKEKFDAYLGVEMYSEDVFDSFTDGLVLNYDEDWDYTVDNYARKTITGSSIIYTGATVDGTLSGQLVRNCFKTAARFFCNYSK